jgi:hypothetical protein
MGLLYHICYQVLSPEKTVFCTSSDLWRFEKNEVLVNGTLLHYQYVLRNNARVINKRETSTVFFIAFSLHFTMCSATNYDGGPV